MEKKTKTKNKKTKKKNKKAAKPPASPNTIVGIIYAIAHESKKKTKKIKRLEVQKNALDKDIRELTKTVQNDLFICQTLSQINDMEPSKRNVFLKGLHPKDKDDVLRLLKRVKP